MQTFVPFVDWARCARSLQPNVQRAGKQRLEAHQILQHLVGLAPKLYPNHPIMNMWRGYESALAVYGIQCCMIWNLEERRADSIQFEIHKIIEEHLEFNMVSPPWRNDTDLMTSHRSNLVRKEPEVYGKMFPKAPKNMPYLWPVNHEDGSYSLIVSGADQKRLKDGERVLSDELKEVCGL